MPGAHGKERIAHHVDAGHWEFRIHAPSGDMESEFHPRKILAQVRGVDVAAVEAAEELVGLGPRRERHMRAGARQGGCRGEPDAAPAYVRRPLGQPPSPACRCRRC